MMTKGELENTLEKLSNTSSMEERADILQALSNEEQFQLDAYIFFGRQRVINGTLCFPYRNGKYFNDKPHDKATWIPNRYVNVEEDETLCSVQPVEQRDNYRVLNILRQGAVSRRKEDVAFINELYIDLDIGHKDDLTKEEREQLLMALMERLQEAFKNGELLEPTTLLFSGRGYGLHYKLSEPISVEANDAVRFAAMYQCAFDKLERIFEECENTEGLDVDRCVCSISRLARMAGTYNTKAKCMARFVDVTGRPYMLDQLVDGFVEDEDDYNTRVKLMRDGKGITKASMLKFYAKKQKELERQVKKKDDISQQQREKMRRASDKVRQCIDEEPEVTERELNKRGYIAKHELMHLDSFFHERIWIDGSGRYNYALIYYNLLRALYKQEWAEYRLRERIEDMEEPLGEENILRIIDGIEAKIQESGYGFLYSLEKIIEELNIDHDMALECGLGIRRELEESRAAHIDIALERDRLIMEYHKAGMSQRGIAERIKKELPGVKISKATVAAKIAMWDGKDMNQIARSIYRSYDVSSRMVKGAKVVRLSHYKEKKKMQQPNH